MGWFSSKPNQQQQVASVLTIVGSLYKKTVESPDEAPRVLSFKLPDSHFRYLFFCLSTVAFACASKMGNADAVLNECAHRLLSFCLSDDRVQVFFQDRPDPQKAANTGAAYLQDYLHRWSAYMDIATSNAVASTNLVIEMLHNTETNDSAVNGDGERLWPLANWLEKNLYPMRLAFAS